MCKQLKISTIDVIKEDDTDNSSLKESVTWIGYFASSWVSDGMYNTNELWFIFSNLIHIARLNGTTLQECVQIAYDDIKNRKGVVYNGTFIKDTDPAYNEALQKLGKA